MLELIKKKIRRNCILEGPLTACILEAIGKGSMTPPARKPPDPSAFACVLERDVQNLFRSCPFALSSIHLYAKTVLQKTKINDT